MIGWRVSLRFEEVLRSHSSIGYLGLPKALYLMVWAKSESGRKNANDPSAIHHASKYPHSIITLGEAAWIRKGRKDVRNSAKRDGGLF